MIVFIDTPILSSFFRRTKKSAAEENLCNEFSSVVRDGEAGLIGPVRQELLSGIRDKNHFELLRSYLRGFEDIPLATTDFEQAARFNNQCRQKGIQGSHFDFLLCAIATRYGGSIFTTDRDFTRYAKHIDISLHAPGRR